MKFLLSIVLSSCNLHGGALEVAVLAQVVMNGLICVVFYHKHSNGMDQIKYLAKKGNKLKVAQSLLLMHTASWIIFIQNIWLLL